MTSEPENLDTNIIDNPDDPDTNIIDNPNDSCNDKVKSDTEND